ncbi:tyrosine-type recombinase/integrase [Bacillus sp. FJAT-49705]|uniref:Tyrosine-type recombinase/integrase n=2 Tax=Cytobacillus citreus TaxID=2833586 RepID=A0ABS5NPS6_9BACI|nr:tyrosine-type recombinase/integrase [Cytobacillus citreus]
MDHAKKLISPDNLRASAIITAIGLLWATGMRVCELYRLLQNDIDFDKMEIHIRDTKFHKERYIPIHKTVIEALQRYAKFRDSLYPNSDSAHFFLTTGGQVLTKRHLEYNFAKVRQYLLPNGKNCWDRRPPRLYDLRHTFACNTIIRWYKEGADVNHNLLLLSTYLGHVKPSDTYWYLTGTPQLLAITTEQFENFSRGFGMEESYEKLYFSIIITMLLFGPANKTKKCIFIYCKFVSGYF